MTLLGNKSPGGVKQAWPWAVRSARSAGAFLDEPTRSGSHHAGTFGDYLRFLEER